jgi:hypothetical protein
LAAHPSQESFTQSNDKRHPTTFLRTTVLCWPIFSRLSRRSNFLTQSDRGRTRRHRNRDQREVRFDRGSPRYLLHDRDTAFHAWATTATAMGVHEVVTAIRSPVAARLRRASDRVHSPGVPGSVIVANERGLRRALRAYVEYYSKSGTHLPLDKDAPFSRRVESRDDGDIVAIPHLGGPTPPLRKPRRVVRTGPHRDTASSSAHRRATHVRHCSMIFLNRARRVRRGRRSAQ